MPTAVRVGMRRCTTAREQCFSLRGAEPPILLPEGRARDSSDPTRNPPPSVNSAHTPPPSQFPVPCSPLPAYRLKCRPRVAAMRTVSRATAPPRRPHGIFENRTAVSPPRRVAQASRLCSPAVRAAVVQSSALLPRCAYTQPRRQRRESNDKG